MAKPSRKKKRKSGGHPQPGSRNQNSPNTGARRQSAWNHALRRPRKDRDRLVALVLASLVAGFMLVINLDRVTHAGAEMGPGGSRHGWPWIFLKRELAEPPAFFIEGQTYSWPWPAVRGENREWMYPNLGWDVLICVLATVSTFCLVKLVVSVYDKWRYGEATLDL